MKPRRGSIAVCSAGFLGLITVDKPQRVVYPDATEDVAWVGIHLVESPEGFPVGRAWSSRNPKVLCHVDDLEKFPQWISVKDQPIPVDEKPILVYLPEPSLGSRVHSARYCENFKVIGQHFAFDLPKPTHWMPQPPPPEGQDA